MKTIAVLIYSIIALLFAVCVVASIVGLITVNNGHEFTYAAMAAMFFIFGACSAAAALTLKYN